MARVHSVALAFRSRATAGRPDRDMERVLTVLGHQQNDRARRGRHLGALIVAAATLLVAPVAAAQSPPGPTTPPATTAPPTTTAPAPTVPTPTSPAVPSIPAGPGGLTPTTAPLPVAPPIGDGAEIPEPTAGDSFGLPVPSSGPSLGTPLSPSSQASFDAARAAIADQIAERGDALAVANEIETGLSSELDAADAALGDIQTELDQAVSRQNFATKKAAEAADDAEYALAEAREARRELRDLAVVMYIDPPQQLQVVAALNGGMAERLAAESLLAAKSDVSQQLAERTARAERRAERTAMAKERTASIADERTASAEQRLEEYQTKVVDRQTAVDRAKVRTAALKEEVGALGELSPSLESRLGIESAITSGSVQVAVQDDGTWSVQTVGFPGAGDILRLTGTTITVHRLIADQVAALLNAAAQDGVVLDGWGYRDTQRQIELRRAHCGGSAEAVFSAPSSSCSPPTARPGRSMHERGLAVDFKNCSSRSTPCYQWLSRNAARFGLFNLPSEPWHWSTNGN